MSAENRATALCATVRRRARRDIHANGRDAAGICSWRWWSMLSRPIGPEFLAPLQLLGQASVCVSERSARIVRPTPTAGRTGRRALSASRRREAVRQMWYTTALRRVVDARTPIGELPRAHALLRSSRCALRRIPAHPRASKMRACACVRGQPCGGAARSLYGNESASGAMISPWAPRRGRAERVLGKD
jgi:hypothetical protein